jgi:alpha-methylacyl-CoA racemase
MGILAALVERASSGRGDVVDAAMVDGVASLMIPTFQMHALGVWRDERGVNLLDGGAPFYDTFETADGEAVAVGPLEPQFYAEFVSRLGLDVVDLPHQLDVTTWPDVKARFAAIFRTDTRDAWTERFAGSDACVAPVLSLTEAPEHPHNRARGTFIDVGGVTQAAPAPRFRRSSPSAPAPPVDPGADTRDILESLGFSEAEIDRLSSDGAVA